MWVKKTTVDLSRLFCKDIDHSISLCKYSNSCLEHLSFGQFLAEALAIIKKMNRVLGVL